MVRNKDIPPGDILVLAPRRVIGTPLYERLVSDSIPVKSYYAEGELDEEDAQQQLAFLKLFVDPEDRVALRWLLGFGAGDWRAAAYGRLRSHCESNGLTPWEALEQLAASTIAIPYTGVLVERFREIREKLQRLEGLPDIAAVVNHLLPEADDKVRALRQIAMQVLKEVGEADKREFLSELSNVISKPEVPDEIKDVRIMSLHKSKGLSAPVTFVCGCVQGLLPRQPDPDKSLAEQKAEAEEQRRLFYVGITRVKAEKDHNKPGTLIITYSQRMSIADVHKAGIQPAFTRNGLAHLHASPFLTELGPAAPKPVSG